MKESRFLPGHAEADGGDDASYARRPAWNFIVPNRHGFVLLTLVMMVQIGFSGAPVARALTGPVSVLTVGPTFQGQSTTSQGLTTLGTNQAGTASIAVGPKYVIEMTSGTIAISTKSGGTSSTGPTEVYANSLSSWFNSVIPVAPAKAPSPGAPYEPHVIYDQYQGKWITVALLGTPVLGQPLAGFPPGGQPPYMSMLLIGVSSSSDPSKIGSWQFTACDMSTTNGGSYREWCDYDEIGFDQNAVYVTANRYTLLNSKSDGSGNVIGVSYAGPKIRVIENSTIYFSPLPMSLDAQPATSTSPGTSPLYTDFSLTSSYYPASAIGSLQPCQSFGPAAVEYFVAAVPPGAVSLGSGTSTELELWSISHTAGSPNYPSYNAVTVQAFSTPPNAAQKVPAADLIYSPAPPSTVHIGDCRLTSAAYRNGLIWTAGQTGASVGNSVVSAIHWMRITGSTGVAVDDAVLKGAEGESFFLPAITCDKSNNTYISFSRSTATTFPAVEVAAIQGSASGTPFIVPVKGGEDVWWSNIQFGFYSGIAMDPADDTSAWLAGLYSASFGSYSGDTTPSAGTEIARAQFGTGPYLAYILSDTGLTETWATSIFGGQAVGYGYGTATGGNVHAIRWPSLTAASVILPDAPNITGQTVGGAAATISSAGSFSIATGTHAALWLTSTSTPLDLNPQGFLNSQVAGMSGTQEVGYGFLSGHDYRALLWSGSASSTVDLTPNGFIRAYAFGVGGGRQVGAATASNGVMHPLMWTGSPLNYLDLLPKGYSGAYALGVQGYNQVGFGWPATTASSGVGTTYTNFQHALLWSGSATSVVDLNPVEFDSSVAMAQGGGRQVGYGSGGATNQQIHALVWGNSSSEYFDLHYSLPSGYVSSTASGIDTAGNIVGTAVDANGHHVAVVWAPQAAGQVNFLQPGS